MKGGPYHCHILDICLYTGRNFKFNSLHPKIQKFQKENAFFAFNQENFTHNKKIYTATARSALSNKYQACIVVIIIIFIIIALLIIVIVT